jgi:hypothetical protein
MPLSSIRLVGKYWGTVGLLATSRAKTALDTIEKGTYKFETFVGDTLGLWDDAIGTWITIFNDPENTDFMPTLQIKVPKGIDKASATLALGLQVGTVFDPSQPLQRSGATAVPGTSVTPSVTTSGDLQVDLKGLNAVPVTPGLYAGPVSAGSVVLATIRLHVT